MPAQFTLPPDTRAVGTGNPPADMNAVVDALAAAGAAYNILNGAYSGGADPTGAADSTAAINGALAAARAAGGGRVSGPAGGSFLISAPLRVGSGVWLDLTGCTLTLAAGSNCNAIQNWAVQANRRITDGVTNGTTTFTSATAAFTGADATAPNNNIRIYYPDGTSQDTTIASVTNGTTVTLTAAAAESGSGLYAVIGAGRDVNVKLTGGTQARPSPNNPASASAHQIRFRHCDRLEIGPVYGSTSDGRYLVSIGDVTQFYIHDILPSSTASDTLHVNGPASSGVISRVINPSPGDDLVAFTCGELGTYADVLGNITDVSVDNAIVPVNPPGSPVAVKILAGKSPAGNPYTIDRITVRTVRSAILNDYPVNICDDPSSGSLTTGGLWGKITVSDIANINAASTYPAVNLIGATSVTDLEANGLYTANPANNLIVLQSPAGGHSGSFVARLKTDAARGRVAVNSGSSIRTWVAPPSVQAPLTQAAVAYFDGSTVTASVADAAVLDITGALSVELWLVPSSSQLAFWTPFGKNGQYFFEGGGSGGLTLAFSIHNGSDFQAQSATLVPGQMNYVAGTFVPSTSVNTYLNGGLKSSNTTSIPAAVATTTNQVLFGNRQGFTRNYTGQLAEARIWNGALTGSDISLHNSDPGNLYATSATLVGRWKCDEGGGTTLNDSSGNGLTATLSGASWNVPYTPFLVQPQLSTGASHTVDDVITVLQKIGLVHQ